MPLTWLVLTLLTIGALGFFAGQTRALRSAGGDARRLHSRPRYYGANVTLSALVPGFGILVLWLLAQPFLIDRAVANLIPPKAIKENAQMSLVMSDVRRVAEGLDRAVAQGEMSWDEAKLVRADQTDLRARLGALGVALGRDVSPVVLDAAQKFRQLNHAGDTAMTLVVLAVAMGGFGLALSRTQLNYRARNVVERGVLALLILAASLAVLTTVGIVLSMLFEAVNFFDLHGWRDFFFGDTWAPNFRGDSDLSILPLLWGTLYISFIALFVAVPVGLYAAIYLSEYAGPKTRAFAKPLLEILAGIPTIVYGLFALLTVGPLLVDLFGQGGALGVNWMAGATSALTAGLVMGVMLIPFVSSLSDDIINAVPQSLRDASTGLGATKSETIRQVVIPAALPGIVGAILLATSRAIGETMIVVMGAGAIAKFSANPLDSMTTITTRIVSQLTGDGDFSSPETLVAFALGLSLFVLTLGLNVLALYVVRTFREQYE